MNPGSSALGTASTNLGCNAGSLSPGPCVAPNVLYTKRGIIKPAPANPAILIKSRRFIEILLNIGFAFIYIKKDYLAHGVLDPLNSSNTNKQ